MFCSRPWLSFIKVLKLWSELSVITAEVSSASRCAADWPFKKDFYQILQHLFILFFSKKFTSVLLRRRRRSKCFSYVAVKENSYDCLIYMQITAVWNTELQICETFSCFKRLQHISRVSVRCSTVGLNLSLVTVLLHSLVWALSVLCVIPQAYTWKTGRRWARRCGQLSASFCLVLFAPLTGEGCCFCLQPTCMKRCAHISPRCSWQLSDRLLLHNKASHVSPLSDSLVCGCFYCWD